MPNGKVEDAVITQSPSKQDENTLAESPTKQPDKPKGMGFAEAMKHVIEGKRITKQEWGDNNTYCLLKADYLRIFKPTEGQFFKWVVSEGDLMGDDWIVL